MLAAILQRCLQHWCDGRIDKQVGWFLNGEASRWEALMTRENDGTWAAILQICRQHWCDGWIDEKCQTSAWFHGTLGSIWSKSVIMQTKGVHPMRCQRFLTIWKIWLVHQCYETTRGNFGDVSASLFRRNISGKNRPYHVGNWLVIHGCFGVPFWLEMWKIFGDLTDPGTIPVWRNFSLYFFGYKVATPVVNLTNFL